MPDPRVAQRQQVLGDRPRPGDLVDGHAGQVEVVPALHRHDRERLGQAGQRRHGVPVRGHHHGPVHAPTAQPFKGLAERVLGQLLQAHGRHQVVLAPRGPFQARQDAGRPEQGGVRGHHADRPAAPGHQGPGRRVRPVAQLGDRAQHPFLGRPADVGVVAEHAGDRLVGHPGDLGHVGHRGRSPPTGLCHGSPVPPGADRATARCPPYWPPPPGVPRRATRLTPRQEPAGPAPGAVAGPGAPGRVGGFRGRVPAPGGGALAGY